MRCLTVVLILILGYCFVGKAISQERSSQVISYVDPTIGGVGLILEPTRPLVHLPNSMLRVHPAKKDELDDRVLGFPLTVVSHRIGSAFSFLPVFGEGDAWQDHILIHSQKSHPYVYEVVDRRNYDRVSVVPEARSAMFKVENTNGSKNHRLRFSVVNNSGFIKKQEDNVLVGEEDYNGIKVFFYGVLDGKINGEYRPVKNGEPIVLQAGERITITPLLWHAFYPVSAECIIGEVSTANDDENDNFFWNAEIGRFPEVDEDEPRLVKLLSDR